MATGDQTDMLARVRATLPPWFPSPSPVIDGALTGIAATLAFVYSLIQYAAAQTRIATASGGWLDLIAWDFFGARFTRRQTEIDDSFRPRILQEILRPRATRAAIVRMLKDLTGRAPAIFEPWNTGDCASYGTGTAGYGAGMGYGSLALRNQIFVTAFRPAANAVPNIAGFGGYGGGYGVGRLSYIDMSQVDGPVTDEEIYARTAQTVAAGITAWTAIE